MGVRGLGRSGVGPRQVGSKGPGQVGSKRPEQVGSKGPGQVGSKGPGQVGSKEPGQVGSKDLGQNKRELLGQNRREVLGQTLGSFEPPSNRGCSSRLDPFLLSAFPPDSSKRRCSTSLLPSEFFSNPLITESTAHLITHSVSAYSGLTVH